jgi:hypothetical protein
MQKQNMREGWKTANSEEGYVLWKFLNQGDILLYQSQEFNSCDLGGGKFK